jgi:hypothetical protein
MNREEFIQYLESAPWQDIKEEAEKVGYEKPDDEKWKDAVVAIADLAFPETLPDSEVVEVEPEPEEVAIASANDYSITMESFVRVCKACGMPLRKDILGKEIICPVSDPNCPRPSTKEV